MFVDGSIGADLPRQKVSEFFNVNSFIVSQTNPWYVLGVLNIDKDVYLVCFFSLKYRAILWKDKKDKKRYQTRFKIIFQKLFDKVAMIFTSELRHRIFQV
jgi:hypothetical protein